MQDLTLAPRARLAFGVLAIAGLGTASVIKLARGSDHQDTPDVELNPAADMTDVYAFPLAQLPDAPTASAFRNPGIDYVKGFNVLSIVIELPTAQLTAGGNAKIGVWGAISR